MWNKEDFSSHLKNYSNHGAQTMIFIENKQIFVGISKIL